MRINYKHNEETKRKISLANKGKHSLNEFKKGHKINIGRQCSEKTKNKIRLAHLKSGYKPSQEVLEKCHLANKGSKRTEETKNKMRGRTPWNKGKTNIYTSEALKKMSLSHKGKMVGENHPNYRGGQYCGHRLETEQWNITRKQVYARDKWTCQVCGKHCRKDIQCHHIIPYRHSFNDSLPNLITLCTSCHTKEEHKYYKELKGQIQLKLWEFNDRE